MLPPAVGPLEDEAADRVADAALAPALLVDLLPLRAQVLGLRGRVLAIFLGVVGVGAELGEHRRHAELVLDDLEEVARRRAAVDVRAEDVEALAVLRDQVDVLQVAVGDRDRVLLVALLDRRDRLAVQRVEMRGARVVLLLLRRQRLGLEARPRQAVVVLVAEQPQRDAGGVAVLVDGGDDVRDQRRALARVGVVDLRDPDAVDGRAVAAHRVVDHRVDAVVGVDPCHPARRDVRALPDHVDAHRTQQLHVATERALDELVGLRPQRVGVVRADRRVAPVHAADQEVLAVDLELVAALVGDDVRLGGVRDAARSRRARAQDEREPHAVTAARSCSIPFTAARSCSSSVSALSRMMRRHRCAESFGQARLGRVVDPERARSACCSPRPTRSCRAATTRSSRRAGRPRRSPGARPAKWVRR